MPETQDRGTAFPQGEGPVGIEQATLNGQPAPEEEQKNYAALKCYFFTPKRGDIRGAFCLLFDGGTGEILENVFWVTLSVTGLPVDVHQTWREFNRSLPSMGAYEKAMGDKMTALLRDVFPAAVRKELFRETRESALPAALLAELRRSYERLTYYFLEFETELERLSRRELIAAGVLVEEKPEDEKNDVPQGGGEEKSFAGTLITCLPVIDPVKGTPVSELRPGDLVEAKIQGGIGASGLIRQYLTSTSQDAVFPVETVEKKADDKIYVLLAINEEVRGLITLTKDLRLRTLHRAPLKRKGLTVNRDSAIFFGTLVVAIAVIAAVVRFLLF